MDEERDTRPAFIRAGGDAMIREQWPGAEQSLMLILPRLPGRGARQPPLPSTTVQKTFTGAGFSESGRYLVICNRGPHFTEFKMYRWVNVT